MSFTFMLSDRTEIVYLEKITDRKITSFNLLGLVANVFNVHMK